MRGLRCRIVGLENPLGDDLAAYLAHAGAIVERSADLASAASAEASGVGSGCSCRASASGRRPSCAASPASRPGRRAVRFVVLEPGSTHPARASSPRTSSRSPPGRCSGARCSRRWRWPPARGGPSDRPGRAGARDSRPSLRPRSTRRPPRGRLILVAEDNETNRKVILRQLQIIGFAAEVCVDGREALKRWRGGDFAMLLTDLNMPEMDGHALARAIRDEEPEGQRMPIIALTANALREEELGLRAAGFDGYLSKPVRLAQLRASIEAWLGPAQPAGTPRPDPAAERRRSTSTCCRRLSATTPPSSRRC